MYFNYLLYLLKVLFALYLKTNFINDFIISMCTANITKNALKKERVIKFKFKNVIIIKQFYQKIGKKYSRYLL